MKTFLAKAYRAVRQPQVVLAALERRRRLANAGSDHELQKFWRDQGAEWMSAEASEEEVHAFNRLSKETSELSPSARRARIVSALQNAWATTYLHSAEGIDWDVMQENLPEDALICFFEGAFQSRTSRKTSGA